ncbi:MAG: hypothetical protein ABL879_12760 [Devosia sp.]
MVPAGLDRTVVKIAGASGDLHHELFLPRPVFGSLSLTVCFFGSEQRLLATGSLS